MRKILAALACLSLLASALTSCGGGGGDGAPAAPSFRVSYDKSTLAFEQYEGFGTTPQTITGTAVGNPGGTVYAVVVVEGQHIDPNGIGISFSSTQVFITVQPRIDLLPGTYTGRLTLNACADAQCTRHFGGSPFVVTTSTVVRRSLAVTPAQLSLPATSGQGTRTRIDVQPAEGFAFTAQADSNSPWISVENADATGFTLVTAPLPGGQYGGSVRVASGPQEKTVPLVVTVDRDPNEHDLQLGVPNLTLSVGATGSTSQTFSVTPPTWNSTVTADTTYATGPTGWLTVTDLGNGTWRATASAATLAPGTYFATLSFRGSYPSVPHDLPVTFVVGGGLIAPSSSLTVDGDTTTTALAGSTPLALAGGGAFTWTAATLTPWLRLDTASGTQATALTWHVDTAALGALENFAGHQGVISVSTNVPNVPPATITIALAKQLAEVHAVTPYLVVRDRASRVLVRGRGFDGVLNLAGRLAIAGVTPAAVTRVNDVQIVVDLPAIATAATTVRMGNALGLDTGTGLLKTAPRTTYAYAALPPSGSAATLLFDAERQALNLVSYFAQPTRRNGLTRHAYNGTAWTSTEVLATDLYDVGLSLDGTTLFAAMLTGEVRALDPAGSGETRPRIPYGRTLTDDREFFLSQGLPVTADGKLWLPLDESPGNSFKVLAQIDLRTGALTEMSALRGPFTFYRGPLFGVARDGSRMMGRQNSGLSSVPSIFDAIKYDAATGTFSRGPGAPSLSDVRFTHDGRLALVDLRRVVDRDEVLHGLVSLPAAVADWGRVAAQITSDGRRVYLLAYPDPGTGDSSTSGIKPRVYVYDSSTATSDPLGLPVLGYFELADYPSGCFNVSLCWVGTASALSPDDGTLFFAGTLHTLVVPIPSTLTPASAAPARTKPAARWNVVPRD